MNREHKSINKNRPLRVIELFAGIGGFRVAADMNNFETIWANDNSSNACKVYNNRFRDNVIVEGDIHTLMDTIPSHDLLTAGFPCQPFSSAGKKKGIADPRGSLFEVIVKTLKKHQPKYFILENVKRLLHMDNGIHFATILSALASLDYRIEWRLLNTINFSLPQYRERVVITGIHISEIKTSGFDPGLIKLATVEDLTSVPSNKIAGLESEIYWKNIEDHESSFSNWGIAHKGKFFGCDLNNFSSKSPSVSLKNVLEKETSQKFDLTKSTLHWIDQNTSVNKYINGVEIISNQKGGARMGYTIFGINGVAPTLTSSTSRHYERYKIKNTFRRLTNIEYARIQGFPDDHCSSVPLNHQYVLYGNAVAPAMINWAMSRIIEKKSIVLPVTQNLNLFSNATI